MRCMLVRSPSPNDGDGADAGALAADDTAQLDHMLNATIAAWAAPGQSLSLSYLEYALKSVSGSNRLRKDMEKQYGGIHNFLQAHPDLFVLSGDGLSGVSVRLTDAAVARMGTYAPRERSHAMYARAAPSPNDGDGADADLKHMLDATIAAWASPELSLSPDDVRRALQVVTGSNRLRKDMEKKYGRLRFFLQAHPNLFVFSDDGLSVSLTDAAVARMGTYTPRERSHAMYAGAEPSPNDGDAVRECLGDSYVIDPKPQGPKAPKPQVPKGHLGAVQRPPIAPEQIVWSGKRCSPSEVIRVVVSAWDTPQQLLDIGRLGQLLQQPHMNGLVSALSAAFGDVRRFLVVHAEMFQLSHAPRVMVECIGLTPQGQRLWGSLGFLGNSPKQRLWSAVAALFSGGKKRKREEEPPGAQDVGFGQAPAGRRRAMPATPSCASSSAPPTGQTHPLGAPRLPPPIRHLPPPPVLSRCHNQQATQCTGTNSTRFCWQVLSSMWQRALDLHCAVLHGLWRPAGGIAGQGQGVWRPNVFQCARNGFDGARVGGWR